ncbi:MAG: trypsin-like peptidase domain-containing protein [Microscillaceae bacterium]|jgi:Do/DeqQ family serine protease|nr:trypsin-like peptidase domain-containing protein [Microscillaceae bacterium]
MKESWKTILTAFFAGILGALVFTWTFAAWQPNPQANPIVEENGKSISVKRGETGLVNTPDFVQASALSTPSVVFIKTISDAQMGEMDFFEMLFGGGGQRQVSGTGSGVIFTADGYIVTNNHVIEGADKIEVIHQKKSYEGKVIGIDPSADLAIVKITAKNLPAIKRGNSKDVQVGEWVLAVGNPFNLTSTVTAGIVSAKGRDIQLLRGQFPIESFIQTDAAINPGNSGGALVNARGELVGINTAILSRTGSYTGYGFAVPVDIVAKIFNDLIQYGEVQKAFTGLSVMDLSSKIAEQYNIQLENFDVAAVTNVESGSEADKAGIKEGDVITKINNDIITGKSSFEEVISYYRPGDKIKITYKSGKQIKETTLMLTNREGTTGVLKRTVYSAEKVGADLETVSKVERDKMGIQSGVRVVKVKRGLFARLRIEEGFIITAINRRPVHEPSQVEGILAEIEGKVYIEGVTKEGQRGYYSFFF